MVKTNKRRVILFVSWRIDGPKGASKLIATTLPRSNLIMIHRSIRIAYSSRAVTANSQNSKFSRVQAACRNCHRTNSEVKPGQASRWSLKTTVSLIKSENFIGLQAGMNWSWHRCLAAWTSQWLSAPPGLHARARCRAFKIGDMHKYCSN